MFVPSNHLNDTIFKVLKKLSSFILDSLSNKMPKGGGVGSNPNNIYKYY